MRLEGLIILPDLRDEVLALVNIFEPKSIVSDELDVVVMGDTTCAIVSDTIHHCNTNVLYCPQ